MYVPILGTVVILAKFDKLSVLRTLTFPYYSKALKTVFQLLITKLSRIGLNLEAAVEAHQPKKTAQLSQTSWWRRIGMDAIRSNDITQESKLRLTELTLLDVQTQTGLAKPFEDLSHPFGVSTYPKMGNFINPRTS
jgi:hypothetical protein